MTSEQFLKDKGLLGEGFKNFFINFPDRQVSLNALLEDYAKQECDIVESKCLEITKQEIKHLEDKIVEKETESQNLYDDWRLAKQKYENERLKSEKILEALKGAIKIEDIWLPVGCHDPAHEGEVKCIQLMHASFKEAISDYEKGGDSNG